MGSCTLGRVVTHQYIETRGLCDRSRNVSHAQRDPSMLTRSSPRLGVAADCSRAEVPRPVSSSGYVPRFPVPPLWFESSFIHSFSHAHYTADRVLPGIEAERTGTWEQADIALFFWRGAVGKAS